MALNELHSLWIGDTAGWIEKLCLKTWLAMGHKAVVWTYGPVEGMPEGIELRDAREIVPEDMITRHKRSGSTALFSDYFRYRMLQNFPVTWADTDVFLIKPVPLEAPYLFGYETDQGLNNAVLRMPANSPLLTELIDLYLSPAPIPFWFNWKRRAYYHLRALVGFPRKRETMAWGTFGPHALTAIARKHGLIEHASPRDVFYPLHCHGMRAVFQPPEVIEAQITANTVSLHMCGSMMSREYSRNYIAPPEGSWLAREFARYDVTP